MGGKIWEPIIPALMERNHKAFAPDLADEYTHNLTEHIQQICTLITENNLRNVVLVGHSYGGMIISGVASKLADRIVRLVFVDAALPNPEQSLFDIISSEGYDPLSFAGLEALPPYVEKLQFNFEKVKQLPKTYIRCMESEFVLVTDSVKKNIVAAGAAWGDYFELSTGHVPMASMPEKLAQLPRPRLFCIIHTDVIDVAIHENALCDDNTALLVVV